MAANSKIILHDVDFRETKNAHCFEVHSFLFLEFLRIREFKGKIARERIIKRRQIQKLFWTISVSVKRNIHSFLFFKFLRIRKFKGKIAREKIIKMAANSKIILDYMLNRLNCETKCNTRQEILYVQLLHQI